MKSWDTTRIGTALFGAFLAALGAFILIETAAMTSGPSYAAVGPRAFPGFIGAGLVLVGLLQVRTAIVASNSGSQTAARYDWRAVAWVCTALGAQVFLLPWIGWIPAATLLFVGVARALGSRRIWIDALIGLVLAGGSFVLFNQVLGLNLPAGELFAAMNGD